MATLKISDLSVGDWVAIDQAELNMPSDDLATAYIEKLRKPIRIKGISEDSDMVIADIEIVDEWGSIMMKCEHIRPIPITAEILEKNGFARGQRGCFYHYLLLDKNRTLYIHASTNGWRVQITYDAAGILRTTHLMPDINSVHGLQHALRFAGVDKEINL